MLKIINRRYYQELGITTSNFPHLKTFHKVSLSVGADGDSPTHLRIGDIAAFATNSTNTATQVTRSNTIFAGICTGGGSPSYGEMTSGPKKSGYSEYFNYGYSGGQLAQFILGGDVTVPYDDGDTQFNTKERLDEMIGTALKIQYCKAGVDANSDWKYDAATYGLALYASIANVTYEVTGSVIIGYNMDSKLLICRMPMENVTLEVPT